MTCRVAGKNARLSKSEIETVKNQSGKFISCQCEVHGAWCVFAALDGTRQEKVI
jgi:hypothetical protein